MHSWNELSYASQLERCFAASLHRETKEYWCFPAFCLPRIPLVPRRPKSGEPGTGKGKDKKADKKKGQSADVDKPDTPVPPSDLDEKVG